MQRGKVVLSGCPQVNFINKNQNIVFTFMKTIKIFLLVFRFALLMNHRFAQVWKTFPLNYSCN